MTEGPWLVVGLGNPGPQYAGNRHNLGQMVVDELARRTGTTLGSHKGRAFVGEARLGTLPGGVPGPRVVLARATSYMNTTGGPVAGLVAYFGVDPARLIVVHDELDVPFGQIKAKIGGGEGGHNGLRDITKALRTKDYLRVRAGIGRPPGRTTVTDFVLQGFSSSERQELPLVVGDAADAVEMLVTRGLGAVQQIYHTKDA